MLWIAVLEIHVTQISLPWIDCCSESAQLLGCNVVEEQSSLILYPEPLPYSHRNWKKLFLCTSFFVCPDGVGKAWIRTMKPSRNFGETSQSLTRSCSWFSSVVQEEAQTKKRSSETACHVPAATTPPRSILSQPLAPQAFPSQPLAPQAFPSQFSPSSRNYWW